MSVALLKSPCSPPLKLSVLNWLCPKSLSLCTLCVSVVVFSNNSLNHRDTEDTEVAQRETFRAKPLELKTLPLAMRSRGNRATVLSSAFRLVRLELVHHGVGERFLVANAEGEGADCGAGVVLLLGRQ
jgi:hypothetical protein